MFSVILQLDPPDGGPEVQTDQKDKQLAAREVDGKQSVRVCVGVS